jgi:hypothetical protein
VARGSSVFFYISGHGFGHASRQIEIINALGSRLPANWTIVVRTTTSTRLFERTVRVPFTLLPGASDTGVIQEDGLRLNERATVRRAREFYETFDARVAAEAALLTQHGGRVVVSDAPPLACAAAAAAGIPSIVISNFTWDWIYEGYAAAFAELAPDVLPVIRSAYAAATGAWRLPMHGGFSTVPAVEDVPFVARRSARPREQVLEAMQIAPDRPLVLVSFGGFGVDGFDPEGVDARPDYTIVITRWQEPDPPPRGVTCLDEGRMYERGFRYEDIVAAADVVVTKPGYGIISECIANNTAVLYTSRGHFVEYDVLVAEMPRYLRCAYLEQDTLLAGRWRATLDRLLASPPPPETPATNGAEVIADRLITRLLPHSGS